MAVRPQAYIKTLTWYKQDKIGDIRRDIIARKLVLSTLTGSDTIHKQYFANVWHKEDREGSLLNYELTGRVRFLHCEEGRSGGKETGGKGSTDPPRCFWARQRG